jgi:glycosyltransferase involved in cell wall biosynthesis
MTITNPPRFSLIVATVGRTVELERLLVSLEHQSYRNFELLLIDQNIDYRIPHLLKERKPSFPCFWLRSDKGLSRARNLGLLHARGEILAFPDDDCWYPNSFLAGISFWFDQHCGYDFLLCCFRDEQMQLSSVRWPKSSGPVNRNNILGACISFGIFVRQPAARSIGAFDETLGLGANTPYGSGEDTDYGLRLVEAGRTGWYEQNLFLHHPSRDPQQGSVGTTRAFLYGSGYGHLLRKHRYPLSQIVHSCANALGGAFYSLLIGHFRAALFYFGSFAGRIHGYLF